MKRFLRVIRFDVSDEHVFERAAGADEWAIPGGFAFAGITEDMLVGKTRQAFTNGFLGLSSFGRSTFAATAEIGDAALAGVVAGLTGHLLEHYDAPSADAAREAAQAEADFVLDLCAAQPINTVFTLRRVLEDGEIREEFRVIAPPTEPAHARVWDVVDGDA